MKNMKKRILSVVLVMVIIVSNATYAGTLNQKILEKVETADSNNIIFNHHLFVGEFGELKINNDIISENFNYGEDKNQFPSMIATYDMNGYEYLSLNLLSKYGITYKYNEQNDIEVKIPQSSREESKLSIEGNAGRLDSVSINYANSIKIDIPYKEFQNSYVVDQNGEIVEGLEFEKGYNSILIKNTYYLNLGKTYTLIIVKDDVLIKKDFTINKDISLDSFENFKKYPMDIYYVTMPIDEEYGIHHPYIIQFPNKKNTTKEEDFKNVHETLLVETDNSSVTPRNDFQYYKAINGYFDRTLMTDLSRREAQVNKKSYIGVYTIFPRIGRSVYTHALDRETVFNSEERMDSYKRGNIYRIDIQHKKAIEKSQEVLRNLEKRIDDKVLLIGFSASADFATRFNYLHPDLAKGVIVNASPTLPLVEYKEEKLRYPLGMGDIQEVTGEKFDLEKFLDTPQFWMTGENDTNDGTYMVDGWGNYGKGWQGEGTDWNEEGSDYRRLFGDEIRQRKDNINKIFKEEGINNIEYHKYDLGHSWNDKILDDILNFIDRKKLNISKK